MKKTKRTHILIISDVHLGSQICNERILLETLKEYSYDILIIVGDLYEEGGVISDEQFEVIIYLRENKKRIIYIDGNHDPAEQSLVSGILDVDVEKNFKWHIAGRKFCALHGHQFDRICFIFSEPLIDQIFLFLIKFLKRINIQGYNIKKWLGCLHDKFSLHIAKKAKKYAKKHGVDVVICGHTHKPLHLVFTDKTGTIDYYNCGGWIDDVCSFITIDENGKVELHSVATN